MSVVNEGAPGDPMTGVEEHDKPLNELVGEYVQPKINDFLAALQAPVHDLLNDLDQHRDATHQELKVLSALENMRELLYKVFLPFMRRIIDDLDKPSAQLPLDSPFLADFMNKLNIKDVNATSPPASRQDAGSDEDEVELSEDESTQEDDDEPDEDEEPEDEDAYMARQAQRIRDQDNQAGAVVDTPRRIPLHAPIIDNKAQCLFRVPQYILAQCRANPLSLLPTLVETCQKHLEKEKDLAMSPLREGPNREIIDSPILSYTMMAKMSKIQGNVWSRQNVETVALVCVQATTASTLMSISNYINGQSKALKNPQASEGVRTEHDILNDPRFPRRFNKACVSLRKDTVRTSGRGVFAKSVQGALEMLDRWQWVVDMVTGPPVQNVTDRQEQLSLQASVRAVELPSRVVVSLTNNDDETTTIAVKALYLMVTNICPTVIMKPSIVNVYAKVFGKGLAAAAFIHPFGLGALPLFFNIFGARKDLVSKLGSDKGYHLAQIVATTCPWLRSAAALAKVKIVDPHLNETSVLPTRIGGGGLYARALVRQDVAYETGLLDALTSPDLGDQAENVFIAEAKVKAVDAEYLAIKRYGRIMAHEFPDAALPDPTDEANLPDNVTVRDMNTALVAHEKARNHILMYSRVATAASGTSETTVEGLKRVYVQDEGDPRAEDDDSDVEEDVPAQQPNNDVEAGSPAPEHGDADEPMHV